MLRPGTSADRRQHDREQGPGEQWDRSAHEPEERRTAAADQPGRLRGEPAAQEQRRPQLQGQPRAHVEEADEREQPHGHSQADGPPAYPGDQSEHDRRHQHQNRDPRRDDPGEIAAQAVEVAVDQSPVHHQEAEVEEARDQADPGRQQQDRCRRDANRMRSKGSLAHQRLGHTRSRVSRLKIHRQAHPPCGDITASHYTDGGRICKTRRREAVTRKESLSVAV